MIPEDGRVSLHDQAADMVGVSEESFSVGALLHLIQRGRFSESVEVGWGLNVHEVTARDRNGSESTTLCAFLRPADSKIQMNELDDAVVVRLGADGLDDGVGERPFGSIGDVVRAVTNSQGLVDFLNANGRSLNPIMIP